MLRGLQRLHVSGLDLMIYFAPVFKPALIGRDEELLMNVRIGRLRTQGQPLSTCQLWAPLPNQWQSSDMSIHLPKQSSLTPEGSKHNVDGLQSTCSVCFVYLERSSLCL